MLLLSGEPLEIKPDYWKLKLHAVPPMQLPADYARPVLQYYHGEGISFSFDKKLSDQLHLLSYQQDANIHMLLLAAFKVLLYRYSNMEGVSVESLVPVTEGNKINEAIDFFVKRLVLHSKMDSDMSFSTFLQQIKALLAQAHNDLDN